MINKIVSLEEFINNSRFSGKWKISYHDEVHIPSDKFVDIGEVEFLNNDNDANSPLFVPFKFLHYEEKELIESLKNAGVEKEDKQKIAIKIIVDVLGESITRCGLNRPTLHLITAATTVSQDALSYLAKLTHIVFLTDTSALRRGSVSFVTASLPQTAIWTIVPVFVMIEVQDSADKLASALRAATRENEKKKQNFGSLRTRPLVTCIAREIQNIKSSGAIEFAQAAPELIRRIKGFSVEEAEKDQETLNDPVNDRLIIEETKNLRRQRSLSENFFLLTSDSRMAKIAHLEGVNAIYVETPPLPKEITSIRYNSYEPSLRSFVLCPIHYFLWDLVAVFSKVRFTKIDNSKSLELIYYSTQRRNLTLDTIEVLESSTKV